VDSILFDVTPRLVIFLFVLAGLWLSFELGFAVGKRRRQRHSDEEKNLGPMVTGVLGLLAFILALSFSVATSRFDQRKQNVLLDANAISTAYLRALLVDNAQGERIRALLKEYTELRAHFADNRHPDTLPGRVQDIQVALWKEVMALNKVTPGPTTAFLASALNEVFDLHEKRINDAVYNRFGLRVWTVIMSIALLGMLMLGIQGGLSGNKSLVGLLPFALALTAMVYLIADLDSPQQGVFTVSQQPMVDTLESIKAFELALRDAPN
jgi:hypothetical protein